MKILVIKASTVVEEAFEDSEVVATVDNGGKTWFTVDEVRFDARPANEYTLYTDITLPSDYKHEKYKYDGTTFTANADYVADTTYIKMSDDGMFEEVYDKDDDGVEHFLYRR